MKHRFSGLRPSAPSWARFTSTDWLLPRIVIAGSRWLHANPPTRTEMQPLPDSEPFDYGGLANEIEAATAETPKRVAADLIGTLLLQIVVCQSDAGIELSADLQQLIGDALVYLSVEPPDAATPGQFDVKQEQLTPEDLGGLLRVYTCIKSLRSEDATWGI